MTRRKYDPGEDWELHRKFELSNGMIQFFFRTHKTIEQNGCQMRIVREIRAKTEDIAWGALTKPDWGDQ